MENKLDKKEKKVISAVSKAYYGIKPNVFSNRTFKKIYKHPKKKQMIREYKELLKMMNEFDKLTSDDNPVGPLVLMEKQHLKIFEIYNS